MKYVGHVISDALDDKVMSNANANALSANSVIDAMLTSHSLQVAFKDSPRILFQRVQMEQKLLVLS